jgi:ABC-type multidrug transport system ATPase subunit
MRARIGVTLETPLLPPARKVRDLLALVARTRTGADGQRPALTGADVQGQAHALATLGLEHWNDRKLGSLSARELRTLELVLALDTPRPVAMVLTEPGAGVTSIDRDALRTLLARAAAGGACVVVATASVSDALELAQVVHMLEAGRIVRSVPVDKTGSLVPGRGIELRVEIDRPRAFVAELTDDASITGIDWNQTGGPSIVSVRGEEIDEVALAVARAVAASGGKVRSIAPVAPGLDEIRAASAGLALAAYHAAYAAYTAYATPWVDAARHGASERSYGSGAAPGGPPRGPELAPPNTATSGEDSKAGGGT